MSRIMIVCATFFGCCGASSARAEGDDVRPQIVQALLIASSDNDASVRRTAFAALAKTAENNMPVAAALQAGLKDPDNDVRLKALNALIKVVKDPEEKVGVLIELLDDAEERRVDEWGDELPETPQRRKKVAAKPCSRICSQARSPLNPRPPSSLADFKS